MKKVKLLAAFLVFSIACAFTAYRTLACPTLVLTTPATHVFTLTNSNCNDQCHGCCATTFTLSGSPCMPVKYHFTNTTLGWSCDVTTSANPFNMKSSGLRGNSGDNMQVWVEAISGGANSATYNFTCTGACP